MKRPLLILIPLACMALIISAAVRLMTLNHRPGPNGELLLLCDDSMRVPVSGDARENYGGGVVGSFNRRTGLRVEVEHGTSSSLLEKLISERRGDLFLPADLSHIAEAERAGLVHEIVEIPWSDGTDSPAAIAVLTSSRNPAEAMRFAVFLAGKPGEAHFTRHHPAR